MKRRFLPIVFLLITGMASAQGNSSKLPSVDQSPMDMAYYPVNYPILKIQDKVSEPLIARVIYSRPQRNNRTIFGELIEYNKVWRLGANEATEIEFFRDVKINGRKIPKGRYTLYAVVNPDKWTLIFNKDTDTWGAFKYDEKKDLARIDFPVQKTAEPVDAFTMSFSKSASGTDLMIAWDAVMITVPISLK